MSFLIGLFDIQQKSTISEESGYKLTRSSSSHHSMCAAKNMCLSDSRGFRTYDDIRIKRSTRGLVGKN